MSVDPQQPTEEHVIAFGEKLVVFKGTLTPGENALFSQMMVTAQQALQPDVAGFDADGAGSDLLTKLNWDSLTALSLDPSSRLPRAGALENANS